MQAFTLITLCLFGIVAAQDWTVTAYDGEQCTSLGVAQYTPFVPGSRECRVFEHYGDTLSVIFSVSDSASSGYAIDLHMVNGCTDHSIPGGNAVIYPGGPTYCLPLNGAQYFSVTPEASDAIAVRQEATLHSTAISVRGPSGLMVRQMNDMYGWYFARAGLFVTVYNGAYSHCPAFFDSAGEAISCGLYVSVGVVSALFVADEVRRTFYTQARPQGRRRDSARDLYAEVFGISDTSVASDNILPGMTVTFTKTPDQSAIGKRASDESPDTYLHVHVQMTSHESGNSYDALMDLDTASNHTMLSSRGHARDPSRRRQDNVVTGYYSYDGFSQDAQDSTPPNDESSIRALGEQLWNHAQNSGAGAAFCANLGVPQSNGLLAAADRGYFAILQGQFYDQLQDCPN